MNDAIRLFLAGAAVANGVKVVDEVAVDLPCNSFNRFGARNLFGDF